MAKNGKYGVMHNLFKPFAFQGNVRFGQCVQPPTEKDYLRLHLVAYFGFCIQFGFISIVVPDYRIATIYFFLNECDPRA